VLSRIFWKGTPHQVIWKREKESDPGVPRGEKGCGRGFRERENVYPSSKKGEGKAERATKYTAEGKATDRVISQRSLTAAKKKGREKMPCFEVGSPKKERDPDLCQARERGLVNLRKKQPAPRLQGARLAGEGGGKEGAVYS